ncbi:MAG: hypothetical protein OEW19_20620 [Acidobacteriota bacterium]|nr:hypothetical protein [Acidobacteriota bacterium]
MASGTRRAAQRRADRIRAFRDEVSALQAEQACPLTEEQLAAIAAHHGRLLAGLSEHFDIDRSADAGQLSKGLRLASLLGAAALVAAITTLIERVWGRLGLASQVTMLCAFPLASLAGVQMAAERERTRYVAGLLALVACGTAWVAIVLTSRVLDIPFSALLLWPGVGFGLALAMSYGFRSVLAISLAALTAAMAGVFFEAGGVPWTALVERLEPLAGSALAMAMLARYAGAAGDGFEESTRLTGMVIGLGALLGLASVHGASLLAFSPAAALYFYQAVMLVVSLVLLWRRLRADDSVGVGVLSAYLSLFLLIRYVDWFWDALPAWAFFLGLAAVALTSIGWLRRRRGRLEAL